MKTTNKIGPSIVITVLAFVLLLTLFGESDTGINEIIYWVIAIIIGIGFYNVYKDID